MPVAARALILALLLVVAGCAAESAGRVECRHGDVEPDRVCIAGRWVKR
jgi:hypothetical protein